MHQLYIDVNSLTLCTNSGVLIDRSATGTESSAHSSAGSSSSSSSSSSSTQPSPSLAATTMFSSTELAQIRSIAQHPRCFGLLVASFCRDIFGHELVKAGILLSLFGGTSSSSAASDAAAGGSQDRPTLGATTALGAGSSGGGGSDVRSDIHVLIVGDPGMGKSQMLRAITTVAPKAVSVTGHSSTVAGLTATVGKEARAAGGDVVIEAGAMVRRRLSSYLHVCFQTYCARPFCQL